MLVDCFKRRTNAVAALTRKELVQKGTDLIDYAPKDHSEMMERLFFAIAKQKT